ncbi:MAG: ATP-binding cassette domain-containing protein [Bacteroidia bacterium]|nr:ATP-binding cassette domain-containing protein [Bacteroidia bacterium]
MLAGELAPDRGERCYPGLGQESPKQLDWFKLKMQIAYVPQDLPKWIGNLKQQLHYEASIHGLSGVTNDDAVDYIVARLGLTNHLSKRWEELSGGYKLRFALARAVVWKPRFLIIDEPLANLDVKSQVVFLSDLRSMAKSLRHPICVLISSQHIHELESIVDKLVFLRQGQVLYQGSAAELHRLSEENVLRYLLILAAKNCWTSLKILPI